MVNENGSPETLTPDNTGSKKYTFEMQNCIEDYANEFIGLKAFYMAGGIAKVNDIMKSHKIKTFEEYLEEKKNQYRTVTTKEYNHPIVQNKTRELNKLAVKLNAEGATMSKEDFEVLINRVTEIIH